MVGEQAGDLGALPGVQVEGGEDIVGRRLADALLPGVVEVVAPGARDGERRVPETEQRPHDEHGDGRVDELADGLLGKLLAAGAKEGGARDTGDGGRGYVAEEDARYCLQDIQRSLRRDAPRTREVLLTLTDWALMRAHVVPMMLQYNSERDLLLSATKARRHDATQERGGAALHAFFFFMLLRGSLPCARRWVADMPGVNAHRARAQVAVFLTLPAEPDADNAFEQLQALQRNKAAFLESDALTAVTQLLAEPLSRRARAASRRGV